MRLLVTGAAGFIGSNYALRALARGDEVVGLDAMLAGSDPRHVKELEGHGGFRFVRGDVADPSATRKAVKDVDAVVHFAALSHVDQSLEDAGAFVRSNVLGTQVLLEAVRRERPETRFLLVSTDEVYGEAHAAAFTEATPVAPRNPYSASKAGSEHMAAAYANTWGLDVVVTRCSNNYGPRQDASKFIPKCIERLARGQPVPVYGDGRQQRDWLHVDDHNEAIDLVLASGKGGVWNIGTGLVTENLELVRMIASSLGVEPQVEHVPDRPGHDRVYCMDASKLTRELGWRPRTSLGEGIRRTVGWYRASGRAG